MHSKLYHGAAYYPELWGPEEIDKDIRLMREARINVVRMGEFAWSTMEPEPNVFTLDLFAGVIEKLSENGIETVFCTPTATPPVWLSHHHPERLFVSTDGVRMGHGSRQHFCVNHPRFRDRVAKIVDAIAAELSPLPGLAGWQIDNELKSHVSECCCDECAKQWRVWLEKRYGSVDRLNTLWGTASWSQTYSDFSQIPVPLKTPFAHNPSLSTMYRIFTREKTTEFVDEQAQIIRRHSDAPITHNSNIRHYLDHQHLFERLDFAAADLYYDTEDYRNLLMDYDIWRNWKKRTSFWVMETSPNHGGCIFGYPKVHPKSYLRAEAVAAAALGAGGFCYWLWRQQRAGVEMPHGAVISAWGEPAIGFDDVKEAGEALAAVEPLILGSESVTAEIAITYSDVGRAFFLTEPHGALDYIDQIRGIYHVVLETGHHRDLVSPKASLEGCRLLITPYLPHLPEDFLEKTLAFVKKGGIWIVGPLTGGRNEHHTHHAESALEPLLEKAAGVRTVYTFSPTNLGITGTAFGQTAPLSLWSSFFKTTGATARGMTSDPRLDTLAFLTEKEHGKGKIVMLGSLPSGDAGHLLLRAMLEHYAAAAGVTRKINAPTGTLAAPRRNSDGIFWIVVNLDGKGCDFEMEGAVDLLANKKLRGGKVSLAPYGFKVLKPAPAAHHTV